MSSKAVKSLKDILEVYLDKIDIDVLKLKLMTNEVDVVYCVSQVLDLWLLWQHLKIDLNLIWR